LFRDIPQPEKHQREYVPAHPEINVFRKIQNLNILMSLIF